MTRQFARTTTAPEAFQVAFECMQTKARHFEIVDRTGGVETRQDVSQLFNMFPVHAADIVVFVKPP